MDIKRQTDVVYYLVYLSEDIFTCISSVGPFCIEITPAHHEPIPAIWFSVQLIGHFTDKGLFDNKKVTQI